MCMYRFGMPSSYMYLCTSFKKMCRIGQKSILKDYSVFIQEYMNIQYSSIS